MSQEITVQYELGKKLLAVTCDAVAFERIWESLLADPPFAAAIAKSQPPWFEPQDVAILVADRLSQPRLNEPASQRSDHFALVGFGVVAFGLLGVFCVGLTTIAGWIW